MNQDNNRTDKSRGRDANRDPISGAAGSHPVGTGVGAVAGGAATGAAVGSVAGPIGTVAGIAGGAIVGGLAGKGIAEAIDPTREDAYWREQHSTQTWGRNRTYDDYSGAYRTGYEGYGRYGNSRSFDQCEMELKQDYERNKGRSSLAWNDARPAVQAAWHRVSGGNFERIINYDVHDRSGNKIGTVNNLWVDESGQPAFLGVKTGWIFGKNHVVPVSTAEVNNRQRIIRLPYMEEKVKDAPSFDADASLSDADEDRIYSYYGTSRPQFRGAQMEGRTEMAADKTSRMTGKAGNAQEAATMKLSEEQLKVGKREVQAGGVRLRKVIRTETVNQPVELKREEIVIERVPATGATAGQATFEGEDVFIPLRREEAVIEKEARVREEVRVSKKAQTEQQTVAGQVRKEDVEIEQEGKPRFGTAAEAARQTGRYEPKERGKNR